MSLQERTLVVRNFDPDKTTARLLKELCLQGGPVRKVVMRSDHAFVEYDDVDSVGYSRALFDGIKMFNRILQFEPKVRMNTFNKYTRALQDYINYDLDSRAQQHYQHQLLMQQQQQQIQSQYHSHYPIQMPNLPVPERSPVRLAPYQLQIQNQLGYQLPPDSPHYLPPVQFVPQQPQRPQPRGQFYQRRR